MNTATLQHPKKRWSDVVLTIVNHRPTGDVEKKVTRKDFVVILGLVVAMLLVLGPIGEFVHATAKRAELDAMRPRMEALANQGQDQAALWLVKSYLKDERARLPAMVAKGYPEALYYQGAIQVYEGDKQGGEALVRRAAAQGFAPAIEYMDHRKS